jgi:hypothetical protein
LLESIAYTPASDWEKGLIENQIGNFRKWFFTPALRFQDFPDLHAWLALRCKELAEYNHPKLVERPITDCFAVKNHCSFLSKLFWMFSQN